MLAAYSLAADQSIVRTTRLDCSREIVAGGGTRRAHRAVPLNGDEVTCAPSRVAVVLTLWGVDQKPGSAAVSHASGISRHRSTQRRRCSSQQQHHLGLALGRHALLRTFKQNAGSSALHSKQRCRWACGPMVGASHCARDGLQRTILSRVRARLAHDPGSSVHYIRDQTACQQQRPLFLPGRTAPKT